MADSSQNIVEKSNLHNFTLGDFKKNIEGMVATSENAYKSIYQIGLNRRVKEYSAQDVKNIIERGTLPVQQELSYNYFLMDGYYRRIIIYYATFLKYLGVLIPNLTQGNKITDKAVSKRYYKALDFISMINIPNMCIDFATKALINGTYYGVIQTLNKNDFTILDLPQQYCYSRYKDLKNNDIIEFNLEYFNTIQEGDLRDSALAAYPQCISNAYLKWKEGAGKKIYRIPSDIGICFPFYDGRPFFLSIIPEIINYRDYEVLEKKKDEDEIKKILVQQIPHLNEGTLLFEPPEALEIHNGTVGMLKNNDNVSVLTTYANVDIVGSNSQNETVSKNNLEKIIQGVYRSAGVSQQLFAATGNMALTASIQNDLSLMMSLAQKFNIFFTNILNRVCGNPQVNFTYKILPISYYNDKDYVDMAYKNATSGYSFLLPAIAMGLDQKEIVDIKTLENDLLKLQDSLIPLKTSYTESSSSEGGRPSLSDDKKSDKTIQNIESGNSEE